MRNANARSNNWSWGLTIILRPLYLPVRRVKANQHYVRIGASLAVDVIGNGVVARDKLTSAASKSYGYDSNGNCTSVTVGSSVTSISYDTENRVIGISLILAERLTASLTMARICVPRRQTAPGRRTMSRMVAVREVRSSKTAMRSTRRD